MPKGLTPKKPVRALRVLKVSPAKTVLQSILWRLDRLERQVQTLSELVRDHAEDADRLVRIVAEDRDVLRRELLREHQAKVRVRKFTRPTNSKVGLTN
ncbi:MAG: hypothetical protein HY581_02435 [Nitrospirae bacterium]|nr:hypothetical protein [Nitrospirota bacterium]